MIWLPYKSTGRKAEKKRQHVVEEERDADGHHQALFLLPRHRSLLEADGSIRGAAFNRFAECRLRKCTESCANQFVLGTLFRASQFLSEELPIRLAHRVQELGDLPDGLNDMPSIKKVQDWYAQSFEVGMRLA